MVPTLVKPSPGNITNQFSPSHYALDFGWGNGWTVYAAAAGVVDVKWSSNYGWTVAVDHGRLIGGKATVTRYRHLAQNKLPADGISVGQGASLALIGNTGTFAKGVNHLHFELLLDGVKTDPTPYFATTSGGGSVPITATESDTEMYYNALDDSADGIIHKGWKYKQIGNSPVTAISNLEDIAVSSSGVFVASFAGNDIRLLGALYGFAQYAPLTNPPQISNGTYLGGPGRLTGWLIFSDNAHPELPLVQGAGASTAPSPAAIAAAVDAALKDDFAAVGKNIDDQPTHFEITPTA